MTESPLKTKDGIEVNTALELSGLWRITSMSKEVIHEVGTIRNGHLVVDHGDHTSGCLVSNYYSTRRAALEAALAQEPPPPPAEQVFHIETRELRKMRGVYDIKATSQEEAIKAVVRSSDEAGAKSVVPTRLEPLDDGPLEQQENEHDIIEITSVDGEDIYDQGKPDYLIHVVVPDMKIVVKG